MYLTTDKKKEIFGQYGKNELDTGSAERTSCIVHFQDQPPDRPSEGKTRKTTAPAVH